MFVVYFMLLTSLASVKFVLGGRLLLFGVEIFGEVKFIPLFK
jgi:hypothetical protein